MSKSPPDIRLTASAMRCGGGPSTATFWPKAACIFQRTFWASASPVPMADATTAAMAIMPARLAISIVIVITPLFVAGSS